MKRIVLIIIALVLIGSFYIFKNQKQQNVTSTSPTPTIGTNSNALNFCKPTDLEATLTAEGAAGNIYGTLGIKNVSEKNCEVIGNNYILPIFEAKNLIVKNQGEKGPATFTLFPDQTIYSQIHYPNGPQCSEATIEANILYSYKISPEDSIDFKDINNDSKLSIGVCKSASQLTQIDVWSLSEKPVNQ